MSSLHRFLAPNLESRGRWLRAAIGAVLLAVAGLASGLPTWLRVLLAAAGVFALYEARRGWGAARAGGIRTRGGAARTPPRPLAS